MNMLCSMEICHNKMRIFRLIMMCNNRKMDGEKNEEKRGGPQISVYISGESEFKVQG